jgi:hypothetical protein
MVKQKTEVEKDFRQLRVAVEILEDNYKNTGRYNDEEVQLVLNSLKQHIACENENLLKLALFGE